MISNWIFSYYEAVDPVIILRVIFLLAIVAGITAVFESRREGDPIGATIYIGFAALLIGAMGALVLLTVVPAFVGGIFWVVFL